jgi:peptidoglycan/LPS O-acetylase OafA/YrhL
MLEKKIYFHNLDGLRFISALVVFLCHFSINFTIENPVYNTIMTVVSFNNTGGNYAVLFFFVLSGFLITYLLFEEKKQSQQINIIGFYKRRILRIWPLYYLIVVFGLFIYPILSNLFYNGSNTPSGTCILLYSSFLANLDQLYYESPVPSILVVLWSISVEEQFYLLWPILIMIIFKAPNKIYILIAFICIVIFALAFMFVHSAHTNVTMLHPISSFLELGSGAVLAYFTFYYRNKIEKFYQMKYNFIKHTYIVYLLGVIGIYLLSALQLENKTYLLFRSISILYFSFLILDQTLNSNAIIQFYRYKVISNLGKISYGIYMYHMISIVIMKIVSVKMGPINSLYYTLYLVVSLLLTLLVSQLSFKYFESFFLKLKNKLKTSE